MFVAINYITCKSHYRSRFEHLFSTRAGAIDRMPGFIRMQVLRPTEDGHDYLIMSHWQDEASFKAWAKSPEFLEGHKRGFDDIKAAKAAGEELPMTSTFRTYQVIAE
jgi:heme-degrading monooxygenase HmoA